MHANTREASNRKKEKKRNSPTQVSPMTPFCAAPFFVLLVKVAAECRFHALLHGENPRK